MNNDFLGNDLIDSVGEYLGFEMWSKRDTSKEYDFPGARDGNEYADNFVEGNIIGYKNQILLVYKLVGHYHGAPSLYTLNLSTIKPTKNSRCQKQLSLELVEKIKAVMIIRKNRGEYLC